MVELYQNEIMELQNLSKEFGGKLTEVWGRIFPEEMIKDNLQKLIKHTENFFLDVMDQTMEKQVYAEKEIKQLQEEAETLSRLLHTEVRLPSTNSGMPLLVLQSYLDESLRELRECLRKRREQIASLLAEQDALCEELGEPPRTLLDDPLPTEQELNSFTSYLELLKEERKNRWDQVGFLREEIKSHMQVLELKVTTQADYRLLNDSQIKLSKETMAVLQRIHERYASQVKEVSERINEMRSKLESLWERLETSPRTRKKFKDLTECNQYTYDKFYGELQRCEALKSQNLKKFVLAARKEIEEWWQKTLKSEVERNRFSNFHSDCYTDDLLILHELEVDDLKRFYDTNHQIFELYADRKILWDRMCALEAKASEPGRYNNRGGQLLKEERERKTIANKLPKIEHQIRELVHEFEKREKNPFTVEGRNILDVMAEDWEKKRQEKVQQSSARKHSQTPQPHNYQMGKRTPLSVRNTTTTAGITTSIRKASSRVNLSAMRPVSAQKRRLEVSERNRPVAKRSLMGALNSPSVFLKPTSTVAGGRQAGKKTPSKSCLRAPRVIASSIARRRSGRISTGIVKNRRSFNKSIKKGPPAIEIDGIPVLWSDDNTDAAPTDEGEQEYASFEKSIEPNSRSSTVINKENRPRRLRCIPQPMERRLAHIPSASSMVGTPSKQNLRDHTLRTPHGNSPSCSVITNSRKLTTKNLPIII